ncbi:PSF1 [Candida jiufengensis]|uniref:PSF1 n=1 Tax=Candida jiufengensis TaxID=497108 RepID=UPI0022244D6F|nr:PSF1 [Candida jiufengensis]KAI5950163.1 PSF1 [Candida jiufengensis]
MYGDQANKLILDAKRFSNLPNIPIYQSDLINNIIKEINDLNKDAEYLSMINENLQLEKEENEQHGLEEVEESKEDYKINQCQTFVTHLSMRRNKRCLLAYEKLRSDKLIEFSWLNIDPTESISQESTTTTNVNNNNNYHNNSSTNNSNNNNSSSTQTNSKSKYIPPQLKLIPNYTTQLDLNNLNHFEQDFFKNYSNLITTYKSKFGEYLDLTGDLKPPTEIFIDVRCLKDGGDVTTEYGSFNLIKDSQFYVRKNDVERLIQQGYLEEI